MTQIACPKPTERDTVPAWSSVPKPVRKPAAKMREARAAVQQAGVEASVAAKAEKAAGLIDKRAARDAQLASKPIPAPTEPACRANTVEAKRKTAAANDALKVVRIEQNAAIAANHEQWIEVQAKAVEGRVSDIHKLTDDLCDMFDGLRVDAAVLDALRKFPENGWNANYPSPKQTERLRARAERQVARSRRIGDSRITYERHHLTAALKLIAAESALPGADSAAEAEDAEAEC